MKRARCVLYEPPSKAQPALVVVFSSDGEVLAMRPVASNDSAEMIFAQIMTEVRAKGPYVLERLPPSAPSADALSAH
jgi:hypothetical protein